MYLRYNSKWVLVIIIHLQDFNKTKYKEWYKRLAISYNVIKILDNFEELVAGLRGPPGPPGVGKPGSQGPPGRVGAQGEQTS